MIYIYKDNCECKQLQFQFSSHLDALFCQTFTDSDLIQSMVHEVSDCNSELLPHNCGHLGEIKIKMEEEITATVINILIVGMILKRIILMETW